jgi:hypothetical protein
MSLIKSIEDDSSVSVKFKENYVFNEVKTYRVTILIEDSYKNITEASTYVLVEEKDDKAPTISELSKMTILMGDEVDLKKGVTIQDEFDNYPSLTIDDSALNIHKIGEYKVISAYIYGEKKYGYKPFDVFMLAKNDKILGDNSNHTLKFLSTDEYIDDHTGKPVFSKVIYEYTTLENELYRITYNRKSDISRQRFVDLLPKIVKLGAKLIGFDGSYLRFEGVATIEKIENGTIVESVTENAVWELMYFGKSGADKK